MPTLLGVRGEGGRFESLSLRGEVGDMKSPGQRRQQSVCVFMCWGALLPAGFKAPPPKHTHTETDITQQLHSFTATETD